MAEGEDEQGGRPTSDHDLSQSSPRRRCLSAVYPAPARAPIAFPGATRSGTPAACPVRASPVTMAAMRAFTDQPITLVASSTQAAQTVERMLRKRSDFVPLPEEPHFVALGGAGLLPPPR